MSTEKSSRCETSDIHNIEQPKSILKKVISSGYWLFLGNILNRALGFIRTLVLARLLSPSDFGLFGIAMLVLGTLDRFTITGVEEALIQKKDNIEKYLNTGWTINVIRSSILFGIIFTAAPYAARFFRDARAEPIVKAIALIVVLNGLYNVGIIFFQKELSFKKVFIHRFAGNVADFAIAIPMALVFRNVWALVCGLIVGHFVRFVVSYIIHPFRPTFNFDYKLARELLSFGGWLFGISIVGFLAFQGDDMVVGRVLGTTFLGYYYLAFMISNLPATEISWLVSRVAFPAYSKFQDNIMRVKESYLRVLQITAFISIPAGIGLLLLAPEFTNIFLSEKWLPIITPLQILAISGIIISITATGSSLFFAAGQPKVEFKIQFIRLIILALMIYPLTVFWNINGTAVAIVLSSLGIIPVWFHESIKINKSNPVEYLKLLFPTIIGCIVMFLGIVVIKGVLDRIGIFEFAVIVLCGAGLYLGTIYLIWNIFKKGPYGEVKILLGFK